MSGCEKAECQTHGASYPHDGIFFYSKSSKHGFGDGHVVVFHVEGNMVPRIKRQSRIKICSGEYDEKINFYLPFLVVFLLLFSCQVVADSLQPHGLKHARLPGPSSSPRVCPI